MQVRAGGSRFRNRQVGKRQATRLHLTIIIIFIVVAVVGLALTGGSRAPPAAQTSRRRQRQATGDRRQLQALGHIKTSRQTVPLSADAIVADAGPLLFCFSPSPAHSSRPANVGQGRGNYWKALASSRQQESRSPLGLRFWRPLARTTSHSEPKTRGQTKVRGAKKSNSPAGALGCCQRQSKQSAASICGPVGAILSPQLGQMAHYCNYLAQASLGAA